MNTLVKEGWAYMLMCFLSKKILKLTAIYRCDQTMKDILSIADVLLGQFKPGNPLIENLYAK